jgi:hypothetical protein
MLVGSRPVVGQGAGYYAGQSSLEGFYRLAFLWPSLLSSV